LTFISFQKKVKFMPQITQQKRFLSLELLQSIYRGTEKSLPASSRSVRWIQSDFSDRVRRTFPNHDDRLFKCRDLICRNGIGQFIRRVGPQPLEYSP
jgi:hypothetical protein